MMEQIWGSLELLQVYGRFLKEKLDLKLKLTKYICGEIYLK